MKPLNDVVEMVRTRVRTIHFAYSTKQTYSDLLSLDRSILQLMLATAVSHGAGEDGLGVSLLVISGYNGYHV